MKSLLNTSALALVCATVPSLAFADLKVVASFSIIADIARQIGGDAVEVATLVGADQDAHVYSPSVEDARAVSTADVVLLNGIGFETWSEDLVAGSGTSAVIVTLGDRLALELSGSDAEHSDGRSTQDGHKDHDKHEDHDDHDGHMDHDDHEDHDDHDSHMDHDDHEDHDDHDSHMDHDDHEDHDDHDSHMDHDDHEDHNDHDSHMDHDDHGNHDGHTDKAGSADTHDHHHGDGDPHAWGAMVNALAYAQTMQEAFTAADPENAALYQANYATFEAGGLALRDDYAARIAALPAGSTVVTLHDAFGYMEAETGLNFLAPTGLNTLSAASAGQVRDLIVQLQDLPNAVLFVENITNPALIEQIGAETGIAVNAQPLYSDALSGPDGPAATYLGWYQHNLEQIVAALEAN